MGFDCVITDNREVFTLLSGDRKFESWRWSSIPDLESQRANIGHALLVEGVAYSLPQIVTATLAKEWALARGWNGLSIPLKPLHDSKSRRIAVLFTLHNFKTSDHAVTQLCGVDGAVTGITTYTIFRSVWFMKNIVTKSYVRTDIGNDVALVRKRRFKIDIHQKQELWLVCRMI